MQNLDADHKFNTYIIKKYYSVLRGDVVAVAELFQIHVIWWTFAYVQNSETHSHSFGKPRRHRRSESHKTANFIKLHPQYWYTENEEKNAVFAISLFKKKKKLTNEITFTFIHWVIAKRLLGISKNRLYFFQFNAP